MNIWYPERCEFCGDGFENKQGLSSHENHCKKKLAPALMQISVLALAAMPAPVPALAPMPEPAPEPKAVAKVKVVKKKKTKEEDACRNNQAPRNACDA